MTWEAFIFGHKLKVDPDSTPLSSVPQHLNVDSLHRLLKLVEESTICPGNPDVKFIALLSSRKDHRILHDDGSVAAYIDEGFDLDIGGSIATSTVRTSLCTILAQGGRCHSCHHYRSTLRSLHSRWSRKSSIPAKHANNRYLSTPEKETKLKNLQLRAQAAETEVKRLQVRIRDSTLRDGVCVDADLHQDLASIMESNNATVLQDFPPGQLHSEQASCISHRTRFQ